MLKRYQFSFEGKEWFDGILCDDCSPAPFEIELHSVTDEPKAKACESCGDDGKPHPDELTYCKVTSLFDSEGNVDLQYKEVV